MPLARSITRRQALQLFSTLGTLGGAAVLLAACGGTATSAATTSATGAPAGSSASAATSVETSSAAVTTSAPATASSASASATSAAPASTTAPVVQGAGTLVYWAFGGGGVLGDKLFRLPADNYAKEHAGKVTVQYTDIASGEIEDKVLTAWVSGTGPDVVFDSSRGFLRFMDSDVFLDVTDDFAQRKLQASDWYAVPFQFFQIKGRQMGLPQGFGTTPYGLNLDLFRKAGVALPSGFDSKWTQDDLIQMLKQVVKYTPDGKESPGGVDDSIFINWLWNYGSDLVSADLLSSPAANAGGVDAATWYQQAHVANRVFMRPKIDYGANVSFTAGNVAITGGGAEPAALTDWKSLPFDVNLFFRPKGPADNLTRLYIDGFYAWKQTRVRETAVDFLFYLTNQGCAQMDDGGGYNVPAYRPVVEQVFMPRPSKLNKQVWLTTAEHSRTDPRHPKWIPDISNAYGKYTADIRNGATAPRDAMQSLAHDIGVILQEYAKTPGYQRLVG